MLKLSTINQIVEAIMEWDNLCDKSSCERVANEAVIYYKTAMVCEHEGIDKAMQYFTGTHSADEYQEFRTGVVDTIGAENLGGKSKSFTKGA